MSTVDEFQLIKEFNKRYEKYLFNHLKNKRILTYRNNAKIEYCSKEYFENLNQIFLNGRKLKLEKKELSYPDPALYFFIKKKFNVHKNELEKIQINHNMCMAAEDSLGDLLEEYIYTSSRDSGWVWCSGNIVRSIDFIKKNLDNSWEMLQIKNSDNSENSSSKTVRKGTPIKMWFRRFSKRKENYTNWPELNKLMLTNIFFNFSVSIKELGKSVSVSS